jgi:hypothetical protein
MLGEVMERRWSWSRKGPIVALRKFYTELQNADCSEAGAGGLGATCGGAGNTEVTVVRPLDSPGSVTHPMASRCLSF